jgi:hypothetical protein
MRSCAARGYTPAGSASVARQQPLRSCRYSRSAVTVTGVERDCAVPRGRLRRVDPELVIDHDDGLHHGDQVEGTPAQSKCCAASQW